MQARGYVRFRIGSDGKPGEVVEAEALPAAEEDREARHRRRRRPPAQHARRASSAWPKASRPRCASPTAAPSRWRWTPAREHLFSSKFGCPVCSYSLPELEPRLFSFNSPVGACPACDGLGQVTVFDAERVVAFPSLSLAAGAVKGWDRRNAYTHSLLESVARHYGFDIETPFEQLPRAGAAGAAARLGRAKTSSSSTRPKARKGKARTRQVKRCHPFEGILPNFERRFRETDSAAVREELARYQAAKPCPDCGGCAAAARGAPCLPAARTTRRARASRSTRSSTPRWPSAWPTSRTCKLHRRQGRDRRQDRARDPLAAEVPQRRRPELPQPGPQRRHAVAAARRSASGWPARSAAA